MPVMASYWHLLSMFSSQDRQIIITDINQISLKAQLMMNPLAYENKSSESRGTTEVKYQMPEQIRHSADHVRDISLLQNGLQAVALTKDVDGQGGKLVSSADKEDGMRSCANDSWGASQTSTLHMSMDVGNEEQTDLDKDLEGPADMLDDMQDVLLDYDTAAGFGQGHRRSRSLGAPSRPLKVTMQEVTTPMSSSSSQNPSLFGGWGDSEGDGASLETSSSESEGGAARGLRVAHVQSVKVVGTRHILGGASIGDRLVGVKGYMAYELAVEGRLGSLQERMQSWHVERRYRDFVALYHELREVSEGESSGVGGLLQRWTGSLKAAAPEQGAESAPALPACWAEVTVQSRQFFGNTSSDVIDKRTRLMQACLDSLLKLGPPLSLSPAFLDFLTPATLRDASTAASGPFPLGAVLTGASTLGAVAVEAASASAVGVAAALTSAGGLVVSTAAPLRRGLGKADSSRQGRAEAVEEEEMWEEGNPGPWRMGRTIHLVLDIPPKRSMEELMQAQHSMCAGCGCPLRLSSLPSFAQGLGTVVGSGAGARVCDYDGQLFCLQCHTNESAIMPARVLHDWDFRPRRVSTLAKAYLDSIYDQPLLCVSAVNPYLYSRVPILGHVRDARHKLHGMLTFVRCSATVRLHKAAGPHKYLLERNDFYALRDLTDLSRGIFAGLPEYLRLMTERLLQHMRRCSLCRSAATPCGAPFICPNANDAIFSFQTEGIIRCSLCSTAFHVDCFSLYGGCATCLSIGKPKDSGLAPLAELADASGEEECGSEGTSNQARLHLNIKDDAEKDTSKHSDKSDALQSGTSRSSWPWSGVPVARGPREREDAMVGMSVLHEGSLDL